MARSHINEDVALGYLSALDTPEYGYFGGYLILNRLGRPLEFHCTTPVRPSRAHEILYGPTLRSYLLGEQIGATLLREASLKPGLVITDHVELLALRSASDCPIVMVRRASQDAASTESKHPNLTVFAFGEFELRFAESFSADRALAEELITSIAPHIELCEPFDRIREAIFEASGIGERSSEVHGQIAA